MNNTNDFHLIKRTQHGDTEAFNPLVEKYHASLYHQILGRVKNFDTAKDLTQETFLKAFRAINTFRGEAAFYSWLYRIAENVCLDFFRRQKHHNNIEPLHTIKEHQITQTHSCPGESLQAQELHQMFQNAIAYLTKPRREVFLLYYLHELPIKTIAARLNKSEGTIKSHLRNARLQLQEYLTPYLKNQHIPWLA